MRKQFLAIILTFLSSVLFVSGCAEETANEPITLDEDWMLHLMDHETQDRRSREREAEKDRKLAAATAAKDRELYMWLGIAGLVVAGYIGYQISVKNKLLAEQIKQSRN